MNARLPVPSHDVRSVTLFMAAILLAFVVQIPEVIVTGAVLCGVYAYGARSRAGLTHEQLLGGVLVSLLFLPAFVKPYHGLSPTFYFIATLLAFAAATVVSKKSPVVLLTSFRCVFWASAVAIATILYFYWDDPAPFGRVIEGSSTNGIPSYLIVVQVGLSLAHYLVHRRLPVVSPLFTATVAFFGSGRGSLVVAALLLAGTLLLNLLPAGEVGGRRWRRYYSIAVLLVLIAVAAYGEEIYELISTYTKLSAGLLDTNRLEIWEQYRDKIDAFHFLFGADYRGTIIETEYNNNPHISYIRTHSFFGLPITALAMVSPLIILLGMKKLFSARLVFLYFIGLAALRAYSEPIFFPTILDFFYFTYFLIFFNHAPEQKARRERIR